MFYYNNGKLQIFANTRCGNTNMHHYFNLDVNSYKTFPTAFNNDLIIVLRNPLDRVASSVQGVPEVLHLMATLGPFFTSIYGEEFSLEEYAIFKLHCAPFLHRVKDRPFRIIDFNKLDEYIPRKENAFQSPVTNSSGYTDPKSVYVENQYFTLSDLEIEYETYLELLKDREQVSVTEWKEKTT
jgi:hypothetical protein